MDQHIFATRSCARSVGTSIGLAIVIFFFAALGSQRAYAAAIDPTGRSGEQPSIQKEVPKPLPTPQLILPPLAPAQPGAPGQFPSTRVLVRKINVVGNTVLSPADLQKIIGPYEGKELSYEDLEAMRVALTVEYVNRGYINSGAILPDQTVTDGTVTFQIIEGDLTEINLQGNKWFRDRYIRDRLSLGVTHPFNINKLQEQMQLLLLDGRFESLNADLRPGLKLGESVLNVNVAESFPIKLRFEYNNYQTPAVGSNFGLTTFEHQNVLGIGDIFSIQVGGSNGIWPQIETNYTIPLNKYDTTLRWHYRKNNSVVVESPFQDLDIKNKSLIFGLSVRHPVYRSLTDEVAVEIIGERLQNRTFLLGEPFAFSLGTENNTGKSVVSALRFAQEWVRRGENQVIAARSRFSFGVDVFGATIHAGSKLPDSHFFTWLGQFQWAKRWPFLGIETLYRWDAQLSNNSLFALEQIAVGGRYSVRGYRENTLIRDSASINSLEARLPLITDRPWAEYLQLAPFFDIGYGWNTQLETPNPRTLYSVGMGVRWATTIKTPVPIRPQFEFYWGYQLKHVNNTGGNLQDHGIHLQFSLGLF